MIHNADIHSSLLTSAQKGDSNSFVFVHCIQVLNIVFIDFFKKVYSKEWEFNLKSS